MPDLLQTYRQKRNFKQTPEPTGGRPRAGQALSFVIQKHAASHLHYDFRLELDGTLKSWAVPKGPSLDPEDKRMAVHVEDHPLDYAGFEGVIPPGQYGAGTVIVWDNGEWIPQGDPRAGLRAGKLKFELKGHKLAGHWTLVRMHGRGDEKHEPWLLIKERDEAARPAAAYSIVDAQPDSVLTDAPKRRSGRRASSDLPLALAPPLATLVSEAPREGDWLYELKFDGYRLLARIDGNDVRLFTRNGHNWTSKLKGLAQGVKQLGLGSAWLDGEIVVLNAQGVPDFQLLQNAFDEHHTDSIQYYVFDLPYLGGEDLRQHPLRQRRDLLKAALGQQPSARIKFSENFDVQPDTLLHTACQNHMEGLIGKRGDSTYSSQRTTDWIKLKCTQRQEFVIGGYTDPKGSRTGLGALLLGVHDEKGALHYVGNVGTGFNAAVLSKLASQLKALHTDKTPFIDLPRGTAGHAVQPKLVAEVSFAGWTREGRVRQGVYHGLRSDKPASVITQEKPVAPPAAKSTKATKASSPPSAGRTAGKPRTPKLTHPERVVDPSTGITKLELAQYYAKAAPWMLPHLKRRPVSLVRGPDGINGQLFFQKHGESLDMPGIKLLDANLDPGHPPLLEITTAQGLLGAVQMNVIEFHTWNAATRNIEQPDRMTFDLDPGEGVAWAQIQEGALLVRALLDELGLHSFLKTSGGKGLHVVVPFTPKLGWDAVKTISQSIVTHLARTIPDRFVSKSGPKNRIGKIFVDYLRNGRGATTACAWTARARPGMGVSVPMTWDELPRIKSGAHWTVRSIDERLGLADPWADYAQTRQTLRSAIEALDLLGLTKASRADR